MYRELGQRTLATLKHLQQSTSIQFLERGEPLPPTLSLPRRGCVTIDAAWPYHPSVAEERFYAHGIRQRHQALLRSHRQRLPAAVQSRICWGLPQLGSA